jgi:adenine-specific DNA glycosylase
VIKEIIPKDRPRFQSAMMELGPHLSSQRQAQMRNSPLPPVPSQNQERVTDFPVKRAGGQEAKKKTVLILLRSSAEQGGQVETVLRMRPDRGLLQAWEFPTFDET